MGMKPRKTPEFTYHTSDFNCYVEWSTDKRQFVGKCHELPRLSWFADDIVDAMTGVQLLVWHYLGGDE